MVDELRARGDDRFVHLEREYDATPEELWAAWTEPARLARWLGTPTGALLGATEPVRISMGDDADQEVEVEVLSADPPRLLELAWRFPGVTDSRLRVELVPVTASRTRVVVDHGGLGDSTTGYGAGWQAFLDGNLASTLGDAASAAWDERFAEALPVWRERAAALR
jgi:uncharacterized protein YndB with AHSA1/START domain